MLASVCETILWQLFEQSVVTPFDYRPSVLIAMQSQRLFECWQRFMYTHLTSILCMAYRGLALRRLALFARRRCPSYFRMCGNKISDHAETMPSSADNVACVRQSIVCGATLSVEETSALSQARILTAVQCKELMHMTHRPRATNINWLFPRDAFDQMCAETPLDEFSVVMQQTRDTSICARVMCARFYHHSVNAAVHQLPFLRPTGEAFYTMAAAALAFRKAPSTHRQFEPSVPMGINVDSALQQLVERGINSDGSAIQCARRFYYHSTDQKFAYPHHLYTVLSEATVNAIRTSGADAAEAFHLPPLRVYCCSSVVVVALRYCDEENIGVQRNSALWHCQPKNVPRGTLVKISHIGGGRYIAAWTALAFAIRSTLGQTYKCRLEALFNAATIVN